MARIGSMAWVKRDELTPLQHESLTALATITPRVRRDDPPRQPIPGWVERGEFIGYPIDLALRELGDLVEWEDATSDGHPIDIRSLPDPHHPKAPDGQAQFFADVLHAVQTRDTTLASAPTGSGKTVTIFNTIGHLQKTALIIVPSRVLAKQWKDEACLHLGFHPREVGILEGAKQDWQGKAIVIAVIHNLFLKQWPREFYQYFGFVAWDEAHRLGAEEFSRTMGMFPARHKLAVTATAYRKDGCDQLIFNFFGQVSVLATMPALPCTCWMVPVRHPRSSKTQWIDKCKSDARPLKWLSGLKKRNELIIRLACKLYDEGRYLLILTKYIEHAEFITRELIRCGIPEVEIGQFTGSYTGANGKRKKVGDNYLRHVKESSPVIVATYNMMREGVDIPRIDAAIEALPVADAVQAIGRTRRCLPGKLRPLWFSIDDLNIPLFEAYTIARLRGFREADVTIKELALGAI